MEIEVNYKIGVDWSPKIPAHWVISKLKWNSKIYSGGTPDRNKNEYWINGTIPWINSGSVNQFIITEPSEYITEDGFNNSSAKWIDIDDIVIALAGQGKTKGMAAIVKIKTTCNQSMGVVSPDKTKLHSKYLLYFLSKNYYNLRGLSGEGIRDGLNLVMLGDIMLHLPTLSEQQKIADYLEQKTTQLDTIIARKEKLIELLKEERTAIINQAVTKGIDSDVEMKPSGIDWLGDIPKHWKVKKISRGFRNIGSGTTPKAGDIEYYENGIYPWLQTGDLTDGYITNTSKRITQKALDDYTTLRFYDVNSLVIAMYGATIGKVGILRIRTTTNQACCVLSNPIDWNIRYLYYWFIANKEHVVRLSYGGGQPNISQEVIKALRIPAPLSQEQDEIVEYLDKETQRIDTIISKTGKQIELLKEYKTALINEVVTGQKILD